MGHAGEGDAFGGNISPFVRHSRPCAAWCEAPRAPPTFDHWVAKGVHDRERRGNEVRAEIVTILVPCQDDLNAVQPSRSVEREVDVDGERLLHPECQIFLEVNCEAAGTI